MFIDFLTTENETTKINTDHISMITITAATEKTKETVVLVMNNGRIIKTDEESVVSKIKSL